MIVAIQDAQGSIPIDKLLEFLGLVVAIAGAYWAWKAVWSSKLKVSADDSEDVRTGLSDLLEVNAGGRVETIDLRDVGFVTELKVEWRREGGNALPATKTIYIENGGRRISRNAAIYLQKKGLGFELSVDGERKAATIPVKSFVRRPPDPNSVVMKEIGDLRRGFKHPVTLIFQFESRSKFTEYYPASNSSAMIALHDYYLSDDDSAALGKIMWLNLSVSARTPETPAICRGQTKNAESP